MELQLLSNGFFKKHKIDLDFNEEIMFDEFENNDTINLVCNNYDFSINDLKKLKSKNFEKNILKRGISKNEYDNIFLNYYVEYSREKDEFKIIINIYDYNAVNKEFEDFLNSFGRSIEIIVNLEEEKKIFKEKLDNYCKWYGYIDLEDFYEKEYDFYNKDICEN